MTGCAMRVSSWPGQPYLRTSAVLFFLPSTIPPGTHGLIPHLEGAEHSKISIGNFIHSREIKGNSCFSSMSLGF